MSKNVPLVTGDRISGTFGGKRYQGWFVTEVSGQTIIELDKKYGAFGVQVPIHAPLKYPTHGRKKSRYLVVKEVRKIRKWTPGSLAPNVGYRVHKSRKKGSVRVGDVWITMIEETPEKC